MLPSDFIDPREPAMSAIQNLLVFQQNGSGESKIRGIVEHGGSRFRLQRVSIDAVLPPIVDDTAAYLPAEIAADLVLDYLRHPDLSHDLARLCRRRRVPMVASGKKLRFDGVLTPPT
jgi:hypothetical protein